MKFGFLGVIFLAATLLASAQGSPEEEAVTEMLLAKDSAAVEKHLPEALRNALGSMNKSAREQLLSKPRAIMQGKGLTASQTSDGQALLSFDVQSEYADIKHFELRTQRRISNGAEAVLVFSLVAPEKSWGEVEVWMKLEQGEWRITEFTDPNGYGKLNLEDPDTIAEIVQTPAHENEQSTIETLRTIAAALVAYKATYSEMPGTLDQLGGQGHVESNSQHAHLLDQELAGAQAESGYKIEFHRSSVDGYQITATAIEFGKTGTKNFFMDESEVIRFTTEDRQASASDDPLYARRWR